MTAVEVSLSPHQLSLIDVWIRENTKGRILTSGSGPNHLVGFVGSFKFEDETDATLFRIAFAHWVRS